MYKEEKTFNVIQGKVPDFKIDDIQLAITLDGEEVDTIPQKEDGTNYLVNVTCDTGIGSWNYSKWQVEVSGFKKGTKCNVAFTKSNEEIENTSGLNITMSMIGEGNTSASRSLFLLLENNYVKEIYFAYAPSSTTAKNVFNLDWFTIKSSAPIWTLTALKTIYYSTQTGEKKVLHEGETLTWNASTSTGFNFTDEDF